MRVVNPPSDPRDLHILPVGRTAGQADHKAEPRLASRVTRAFLGLRLDCAECHDHPFASWKQTDFQGLSAFFGETHLGFTGIYTGPGEYRQQHGQEHGQQHGQQHRRDHVVPALVASVASASISTCLLLSLARGGTMPSRTCMLRFGASLAAFLTIDSVWSEYERCCARLVTGRPVRAGHCTPGGARRQASLRSSRRKMRLRNRNRGQ